MTDQSDIDALLAEAESFSSFASSPAEPSSSPDGAAVSRPSPVPSGYARSAVASNAQVKRILSIKVPVIVQLAERTMKTQEVMEFNVGSIIEFDKRFDAELDLIVTNRRIGNGHAVKVGENFGLRIARICSQQDRIRSLGCP